MTPEALRIRDYIVKSAISDNAKNEILPLLGVIDTPGIRERILKILEIEGKTADLEEKFLNLDIDNPQGNVPQPAPAPQAPTTMPVPPVPPMPMNTPIPAPAQPIAPQPNNDDQAIRQLEAQLQQMQQK